MYFYACELYSSNPDFSQREVAKATRAKFKLKKFSHSTVCRSFKAFEESLKTSFGEEFKPCVKECVEPDADAAESIKRDEQEQTGRHFPSVKDTAGRRAEMARFLLSFLEAVKKNNTVVNELQYVKYWYDKNKQLLI